MENIAYTETRDLLERILNQTNPVNNTAVILLVHKSETPQDANPVFTYQAKATIDLLISKQVIRVLNRPGDKERQSDRWKYKVVFYRDKANSTLGSLGKQVTTVQHRQVIHPTIDQYGTLRYLRSAYTFRDKTSARYRLMELLTHRYEELVDKETVYCTITKATNKQYQDLLERQGSIETHEIIKTTCKGLRNEVFKRHKIGLTIVSRTNGIKLTSVNTSTK